MSDCLDARKAWAFLRDVADRCARSEAGPRGVGVGAWEEGGAALRIGADGSWSVPARLEVTRGAVRALDLFSPLVLRRHLTIAQIGQSLDGRVATRTGDSHYVTGPEDLDRLHRLRALVDTVVVGVGTVLADDPRLTVRRAEGRNPLRVVLDPKGRADPDSTVFRDGEAPTVWLRRESPLHPVASHVVIASPPEDGIDGWWEPGHLVRWLRDRGSRRILVEGGGATVSRFLAAHQLDRLHVTVAPVVIGSGRHGLDLPPIDRLDEALRPVCRHMILGRDVLFDLDLGASVPAARGAGRVAPSE